MDFVNLIIDRVGKTNIFNLIEGRLPADKTHLHSIVDDDLMLEFFTEMERLSRISNSLSGSNLPAPLDIPKELRQIGEAFFLQLFPEQIQERLRSMDKGFLFFHIDKSLRSIAWELLHDGNYFLADKFFLGRNIAGYWRDSLRSERDRIRMLIIANPTDDLPWARREGEALFESLNAEVASDQIELQFMSGHRITKFNLLNAMENKDIIHYAGHIHHAPIASESGWLLSGGKVLRAREMKKAGFTPDLIFANCCMSSPVQSNLSADTKENEISHSGDFAGAFLQAGVSNYIGTNWDISDNQRTYDFAFHFYRSVFEEKCIGEALFEARKYARHTFPPHDLTWGNYVLHGNPITRIFRSAQRRSFDVSRTLFNIRRFIDQYPTPIASPYERFIDQTEQEAPHALYPLLVAFANTMKICGSIVFASYRNLSSKSKEIFNANEERITLKAWTDRLYETLVPFSSLHRENPLHGFLEPLYLHKETIYKLLAWWEGFQENRFTDEDESSYMVTFQYLFDNLLSDLSLLGRSRIIFIKDFSDDTIVFMGTTPPTMRMLPAEGVDPVLKELFDKHRNQLCYYVAHKKQLVSLKGYMEFNPAEGRILFPVMDRDNGKIKDDSALNV